ncbi:hypothetical protein Hanom_Chr17g01590351 [Helianthus anomalus]
MSRRMSWSSSTRFCSMKTSSSMYSSSIGISVAMCFDGCGGAGGCCAARFLPLFIVVERESVCSRAGEYKCNCRQFCGYL